jgi:hypothetical protein
MHIQLYNDSWSFRRSFACQTPRLCSDITHMHLPTTQIRIHRVNHVTSVTIPQVGPSQAWEPAVQGQPYGFPAWTYPLWLGQVDLTTRLYNIPSVWKTLAINPRYCMTIGGSPKQNSDLWLDNVYLVGDEVLHGMTPNLGTVKRGNNRLVLQHF